MSEYWKRHCKLTVQVKKGEAQALDLSEMRISFRVSQATAESPKFAEIYVYNLSEETMNLLAGENNAETGATVILEAGYNDFSDIVFKGAVFQYRRGRENPTDKYFCILAQSGSFAHNYSLTNATVAAGAEAKDVRDRIAEDFKKNDVATGYLNDIQSQKYPRGQALFGQSTDLMNTVAKNTDSVCRIEDDQIIMIDNNGKTDEQAIVLTPSTGLIGMPELTSEGLKFTALLNPKIRFGSQVQIDMSLIQAQIWNIGYSQQEIDQAQKDLNSAQGKNGFYNLYSAEYYGDTRGDEWYVDGVAVGVGAIPPLSGVSIKAVGG